MGWSVKIARVAGTEIKIHITFLIFLLWIGFVYYRTGGRKAALLGLAFTVLLFLCVVLHELGHVLTAKAFGVTTPDIILMDASMPVLDGWQATAVDLLPRDARPAQRLLPLRSTAAPPYRDPLRQVQPAGFSRHQFGGLRHSLPVSQLDHR